MVTWELSEREADRLLAILERAGAEELIRSLASARQWAGVCVVCGRPFERQSRQAKHCSPACKQRAYRQRARDRRKQYGPRS